MIIKFDFSKKTNICGEHSQNITYNYDIDFKPSLNIKIDVNKFTTLSFIGTTVAVVANIISKAA